MSEDKRDKALAPNEYMHVLDETKGNVCQHVGATQVSLGGNDSPVVFDEDSKSFERVQLASAIRRFQTAPEGWYIVLKNPAPNLKFAEAGKTASIPDLQVGHKVNIPGPTTFPLWPGQMAKVVKGHHLRFNQYLVGRVYDADAAKEHLSKAVIETQTETGPEKTGDGKPPEGDAPAPPPVADVTKPKTKSLIDPETLTVGKLLIIKGTEVSFFIPPTGIEIVREDDEYVRNAVTLERLEYCILIDENGNKRYEKGPNVVFPEPTETFLRRKRVGREDQGHGSFTRKFRAIELNEQMGLYIKVIADYVEPRGKLEWLPEEKRHESRMTDEGLQLEAGDELFLTGADVKIYYPSEEHAVMKYGQGDQVNYAVAIPAGEGRYLMDKPTGAIETIVGPKMLLPDPREQVIVRRILTDRQCQLMYPSNDEALAWNRHLRAQMAHLDGEAMEAALKAGQYGESTVSNVMLAQAALGAEPPVGMEYPEQEVELYKEDARRPRKMMRRAFAASADDFERKPKFTPPRQLTLNTKFQGAVQVDVWTGYAVQVASKSGERRVVEGPQTILLDYDENLEVLKFSTGTPKTYDNVQESVFLRVRSNRVSDGIVCETRDMVKVQMRCAYRINFEGEPEKWFGVENYVGFATDHLRSMLRGAVKQLTIEEFYSDPINVIRNTILGTASDRDDAPAGRPGRLFEENGMRVYDVEVLDVEIRDQEIGSLLENAQHESAKLMLQNIREERQLEAEKRSQEIAQETLKVQKATEDLKHAHQLEREQNSLARQLAAITTEVETREADLKASRDRQALHAEIHEAKLGRDKAAEEQSLALKQKALDQTLAELEAGTKAWTAKAAAIQPELIAALQGIGDKHLLERMSENMAPMAILGGKSIQEVLGGLIKGTKLEGILMDKDNGQKALTSDRPSRH